jgi:hypothetical protein
MPISTYQSSLCIGIFPFYTYCIGIGIDFTSIYHVDLKNNLNVCRDVWYEHECSRIRYELV